MLASQHKGGSSRVAASGAISPGAELEEIGTETNTAQLILKGSNQSNFGSLFTTPPFDYRLMTWSRFK